MRLLALFALLAFLAVATATSTFHQRFVGELRSDHTLRDTVNCKKAECLKTGAACDLGLNVTTFPVCDEGLGYCKLDGTSTTGTCAVRTALGGSCQDDDDCVSGLSCINDVCNKGYPPSTPCSSNNDCAYMDADGKPQTSCANKKCAGIAAGEKCIAPFSCIPPNVCGNAGTCGAPGQPGTKCTSDYQCVQTAFCNNGTCTAALADGATCDLGNDLCPSNMLCYPTAADSTTGKCAQIANGGAGTFCYSNAYCNDGFRCDRTSASAGTCVTGPKQSSLKSCNYGSNAGCDAGESCSCNLVTGNNVCVLDHYVNPSGYAKVHRNLETCLLKCNREDTPCQAKNCKGAVCARTSTIDNALTVKCQDQSVDYGYFTCDGAFLRSSLILVGLVAALLMMM